MSAFELCNENENVAGETNEAGGFCSSDKLREECIIAFKVYDFCRQQDCLTSDVLGPSRAEHCAQIGNRIIEEGDIIVPPSNAASVSIENLRVKRVIVSDKEQNPFRNGFWDITLKYIFSYCLIFREADGTIIGSVSANSIFTKRVTLFGSIGTEISISTDLFHNHNGSNVGCELNSDPFVLVESKAIALNAELVYQQCCCEEEATEVAVTIGLFTIIKLFRLVNLCVQSKGFCIPREAEDLSEITPCEFFDNLDFPMDIFAPPQRAEFLAGISSNIPSNHCNRKHSHNNDCDRKHSCNNDCDRKHSHNNDCDKKHSNNNDCDRKHSNNNDCDKKHSRNNDCDRTESFNHNSTCCGISKSCGSSNCSI